MHRILIADALQRAGLDILRNGGAEVDVLADADRPRLAEVLPEYDALVVRSATKVTRELIDAGSKLRVIGRAGVGVDNVDVDAATERGILVVNAPTANLMSATEHTFGLMLALARKIPAADASMKRGEWDRKTFVGTELQGKTLGIVGFGRIGQRVAARARGFEMKIMVHDPFLDPALAERLGVAMGPLDEVLAAADVVTLHTPLTKETRNLIDAAALARMQPSTFLVNCGRGGVIDEAALLAALDAGALAGAALDVYEEEPTPRRELVTHSRVVATPHIGAQTHEAQERIAHETAHMVLAALAGGMPAAAVNLPFSPTGRREEPLLRLAQTLGRLAAALVDGPVSRLEVELAGGESALSVPVSVATLKGALEGAVGEAVNFVNAERIAAGRGIAVRRVSVEAPSDFAQVIRVRAGAATSEAGLGGTLSGAGEPRVVEFLGYRLEFRPEGRLLMLENEDVPGVVGRIGTLLGEAGVNIADIHLARDEKAGRAMAVLRLDQEPDASLLDRLRALPAVLRLRRLALPDGA